MRLADLLDERESQVLRRHVPTVDPATVRVGRLPDWYRRLVGIQPDAVTLGSTVLLADRTERLGACDRVGLLAHEAAHVAQFRSGRVGFVIAYLIHYLVGRLGGRSHAEAYMAISFEVLAREVQRRARADCLRAP